MKIQKTVDYKRFGYLVENRGLIRNHINELKQVISSIGNHVPVIVKNIKDKLIIIDGQQRFTALKELGRPIEYISVPKTVNPLILMRELNTKVKKWTLKNFLNVYSGYNRDYSRLEKYMQDTGIAVSGAVSILNRIDYTAIKEFKNGIFKITNMTRGNHFKKYIRDYSNHISFATRSRFLNGLIMVYETGRYDHIRMMDKLKFYSHRAHTCDKPIEYAIMLQNIYNLDEDRTNHVVFVR